jgi:DNA invertase Pin-like site-specific DNA recombinase
MAETKQNGIYGYIRVSTRAQDHAIQKDAIINYAGYRKLNLLRIFEDKASGKNVERNGFQELHKALETNPQNVSAVVVTKLDRLGRSLKDLLNITHWLDQHNIGLIIIESNIDTTTSEGRLFFHFMASIAEYERERILERTEEGRQAAKENGVQFGRRRKDLPMREVEYLIFKGVPISEIARKFKVSRGLVYRRLEEWKAAEHDAITRGDGMEIELEEVI